MSQSDESAEKLAAELAEARAQAKELAEQLKAERAEQELARRLASEGARDLETAVLIAKARLAKDEKTDLGSVVEQLRKEKGYLFNDKASEIAPMRTSPAKEQRNTGGTLERAAKKAAGTGSRSDLQEYMRKRRSIV